MTSTSPGLAIRLAEKADTEALFDICLKTADAGKDASALYGDPRLPGYIWSVPYAKFAPDFTFVLAEANRPVGYVVATPDTEAFSATLEREWWPEVRRTIGKLTPARPRDVAAIDWIMNPPAHPEDLLEDYPAHLHINVLPDAQSSGWGRRLIETELAALKAHGVRGVHLGVAPDNERAKGFYQHVGFDDVSRGDSVTFAMKLNTRP
jgi:ribosomal protein S18 acetylase RimI-like enzyme